MKFHRLANLFPLLEGKEFDDLVDDIRAHGLNEPIWTYEDTIIDGRNRYRACQKAKVEPKYRVYKGANPVFFVISQNIQRRHLSASQCAMLALVLLPELEAEAKKRQGTRTDLEHCGKIATMFQGKVRDDAARAVGVSGSYVQAAKAIQETDPKLAARVLAGEVTLSEAKHKVKKQRQKAVREEARRSPNIPDGKNWAMLLGDALVRYKEIPAGSIDALVTDPPYSREFLPLFEGLPEIAQHVLRPGGIVAVMSGQSYLPQVFAALTDLDYVWTLAYLLPGAETRIFARHMNTHWKPILLFSRGDPGLDWTRDVVVSPHADKAYHEWGQSIKGMAGLLEALTSPNDVVFDPFAGAAATGVAALATGRRFVGIELDEGHYKSARKRLAEAENG